jgi:hypothetical protein
MQNLKAEFESKVALNVVASECGREVIPVNGVCNELGPLEANTVLLEELLVSKRMVDTVGELAGDGLACHEELHFVDGKRKTWQMRLGSVRSSIIAEARDGAAAFGEPIAKRVGNCPAGGSDAVVGGRRHC